MASYQEKQSSYITLQLPVLFTATASYFLTRVRIERIYRNDELALATEAPNSFVFIENTLITPLKFSLEVATEAS